MNAGKANSPARVGLHSRSRLSLHAQPPRAATPGPDLLVQMSTAALSLSFEAKRVLSPSLRALVVRGARG